MSEWYRAGREGGGGGSCRSVLQWEGEIQESLYE